MKGLLSATPAPGPIRLLVGTQLMLLIQTLLVFEVSENLPGALQALLVMSGALGLSALIVAVRGPTGEQTDEQGKEWWRRRHGR
ncbi:hypothetical protein MCEMIE4_04286 [Sphingobium cupriresistens]